MANRPEHLHWRLPHDDLSVSFAKSIAADLRVAGISARVARRSGTPYLGIRPSSPLDDLRIRDNQRDRARDVLREVISHSEDLIPNGERIAAERITPQVRVCETSDQLALFEFCRLSQRVPSGRRIGRQIRALVFDVGQRSPLLIGAIGLASPVYAMACRDRFLEWSGSHAKAKKQLGLRRMMDLHLCIALDPYASLLGGKLLASLAVSSELADEYHGKYHDHLLALVSSCATGLHCAIFNRIGLRSGGLYRRVGETAGYTIAWMSPATLRLARKVASAEGITPHSILSFDSKPLIVVRKALKMVGIPYEAVLRLGPQRGVYVAPVAQNGFDLLRAGSARVSPEPALPGSVAIEHWRDRMLRRTMSVPQTGGARVHR